MSKNLMTVLREPVSASKTLGAGAAAGLGGGLVFGVVMGATRTLPIAGLFPGVAGVLVGLVIHVITSTFLGAMYGLVACGLPARWSIALAAGTGYGLFWWVLGGLILMPLMLGESHMVLAVGSAQWVSLVGHLLYGIITGLLYMAFGRES